METVEHSKYCSINNQSKNTGFKWLTGIFYNLECQSKPQDKPTSHRKAKIGDVINMNETKNGTETDIIPEIVLLPVEGQYKVCKELRLTIENAGINVDIIKEKGNLKGMICHAKQKQAKYVIIVGETERKFMVGILIDLKTNDHTTIDLCNIAQEVRDIPTWIKSSGRLVKKFNVEEGSYLWAIEGELTLTCMEKGWKA